MSEYNMGKYLTNTQKYFHKSEMSSPYCTISCSDIFQNSKKVQR